MKVCISFEVVTDETHFLYFELAERPVSGIFKPVHEFLEFVLVLEVAQSNVRQVVVR